MDLNLPPPNNNPGGEDSLPSMVGSIHHQYIGDDEMEQSEKDSGIPNMMPGWFAQRVAKGNNPHRALE